MLFFFVCLLRVVVANDLSFVEPSSCGTNEYFDISQLTCRSCAKGARRSDDGFGCACAPNAKLTSELDNPSSISCTTCPSGEASSRDGRNCVKCDPLTAPYNGETCTPCANLNTVSVDRSLDGELASESRCEACASGTRSNGERCVPCQPLPSAQSPCQCPVQLDGSCFLFEWLIPTADTVIPDIDGIQSALFSRLFRASVARCEFLQNLTACQVLGNLCVLTDYSRGTRRDACTEYERLLQGATSENLPQLYYEENAALVLDQTTLNGRYSFGDSVDKPGSLEFVVAVYASNGSLLRYGDFIDELQLCSDRFPVLQSAFQVGTTYENECQYKVPLTGDLLFFDVFLRDGTDGKLFEVPVLNENYLDGGQAVNTNPDRSAWQLVRRLFLVDSQSGVTTTGAKPRQVTVADRIEIDVRLTSNSGQIYPPLIKIHYEKISISASNPTPSVPVSFRVVYTMDIGSFNTGMSVAIGIMSAIMFLYAILQIHGWRRRAGVDTLDFTTISTFFFLFCGSLSSSFFWILVGSGVYWLLFFKLQNDVVVFLPTRDQEDIFVALLIVALVLKLLRLVHVVWKQSRVDIFLIDWEKPRRSHDDVESATRSTVSIWRTYFVANEWNELQTMRKISATFQFVVALLLLKVVGFEDVCRRNPHSYFSLARDDYPASFSRILRFGMASSLLLVVALCQWIFFAFVYERFVEDKIRQFVDLCSVANVRENKSFSVFSPMRFFCLDQRVSARGTGLWILHPRAFGSRSRRYEHEGNESSIGARSRRPVR